MTPAETSSDTGSEKSSGRRARAVRRGVVASDQGDKTIVVECMHLTQHAKYGKYMRRRTRLHVHDEKNEAHVGDRVEVAACRPVSKTKSWRLVKVL
jgi:small subunit ribosomal protein S17